PPRVVNLDRRSQEFYFIQRIQDEVHRFAITFHRQLRGKSAFHSKLDEIDGVGARRKTLLLTHFKSIREIEKASLEDLIKLGIPNPVAQNIKQHLNTDS